MKAMHVYWWCMVCDEHGEYVHTAKGEMSGKGTPAHHSDETYHPTMTSIHPKPEGFPMRPDYFRGTADTP